MIYFVTTQYNQVYPEEQLAVIDNVEEFKNLITIFNNDSCLGFDLETTGIDVYYSDILLVVLGNSRHQIVIDMRGEEITNITTKWLEEIKGKQLLGANLKFDYKFVLTHYKIDLMNLYDVMIAEQRIYQGLGLTAKNPTGYSFGLEAIITRRNIQVTTTIDKSIREDFINADKSKFVYTNKHIKYASGDIAYLEQIKSSQDATIKKQQQEYLIYNIEMPLIRCLGKAEVNGFKLNRDKWLQLNDENVRKRYELELKCDKELKYLLETLPLTEEQKLYFKASNYFYERPPPVKVDKIGLFGEPLDNKAIFGKKNKKINVYSKVLNYTSDTQLIHLFAKLGQELPTKNGLFIVPILNDKGQIENSFQEFTTGADALSNFVNENPNCIMNTLIKDIIEIRSLSTKIDTFGEAFLNKFTNRVTNKVHTFFRQAVAVTGRLQSGDKDHDYYNSQNIPAEVPYRECFQADDGYSISTSDLTGAEVIILASKSQDKELKRMAIEEDDIHSPLAQDVWRHIYLYRAFIDLGMCHDFESFKKSISAYTKEELEESVDVLIYENVDRPDVVENLKLYKNFIVTKKINKPIRTAFKATSFGSVYGMFYKKTAKTLGVNNEEGKICLWRIKSRIPDTFRLVETNAKLAVKQGYLILNTKTNSRIWYPDVLRLFKYKIQLEFMAKIDIESSAKNSPIQGTQADMIKEAIVDIQRYIDEQKLDCSFKKSIHDELVYQQPLNMDGTSKEWNENPVKVKFINSKNELVEDSFVELVKETMKRVANSYLTNVSMEVETAVKLTWTK
jgi:DNA polymerase I-like protein with 3'-5' exonuclease and polymerase domains